jgi:hypothetical protein
VRRAQSEPKNIRAAQEKLKKILPGVAGGGRRQRFVVVAEGVHVEEPGRREEQGEHVRQGHGHQHCVGGRAHVPLGQHHHDQRVGDHGHHQQKGHHVAVERLRVPDRQLIGHVQIAHLAYVPLAGEALVHLHPETRRKAQILVLAIFLLSKLENK